MANHDDSLRDFPDLGALPSQDGWEEQHIDQSVRATVEAGYPFGRPRSTRARHQWTVKYEYIRQDRRDALRDFVDKPAPDGVAQVMPFNFTHPVTGDNLIVRFVEKQLPSARYMAFGGDGNNPDQGLYQIDFQIEEI